MKIKVTKHDNLFGDFEKELEIKNFAQLVKADRLSSGLNALEYSNELGITKQTIYNVESGQAKFDKIKMAGFAALRGYDVDEVLNEFYYNNKD